jgi:hypothetical protein
MEIKACLHAGVTEAIINRPSTQILQAAAIALSLHEIGNMPRLTGKTLSKEWHTAEEEGTFEL